VRDHGGADADDAVVVAVDRDEDVAGVHGAAVGGLEEVAVRVLPEREHHQLGASAAAVGPGVDGHAAQARRGRAEAELGQAPRELVGQRVVAEQGDALGVDAALAFGGAAGLRGGKHPEHGGVLLKVLGRRSVGGRSGVDGLGQRHALQRAEDGAHLLGGQLHQVSQLVGAVAAVEQLEKAEELGLVGLALQLEEEDASEQAHLQDAAAHLDDVDVFESDPAHGFLR
jgi:hypothetical protein